MSINVEPRIASSLLNKHIEFDCETLGNILGISKEGPKVFEVQIIPTIGDFEYDEALIMYTSRPTLLLKQRIKVRSFSYNLDYFHRIIAYDILL